MQTDFHTTALSLSIKFLGIIIQPSYVQLNTCTYIWLFGRCTCTYMQRPTCIRVFFFSSTMHNIHVQQRYSNPHFMSVHHFDRVSVFGFMTFARVINSFIHVRFYVLERNLYQVYLTIGQNNTALVFIFFLYTSMILYIQMFCRSLQCHYSFYFKSSNV